MPQLNIRARPPRSTQAFIDPSVTAGFGAAAAEFGEAVASTGVLLSETQRRRNAELAKTDLAAMQAATDAGRNEFLRSLRTTDESYNEINARWQKESKKLYKTIGQTSQQREAQRRYGQWVKSIKPDFDRDIDNIAWGVSVPRAKAQLGNAAAETLRTNPDFAEGLLIANQTIEASTLLTSEEKDLTLANAIIDTNPQWYIDNKDSDMGKELFGLLSIDQKRSLETKANQSINRIREDQQQARTELNNETRKEASDRLRTNTLTSDWLQTMRPNMSAPDYDRYNRHLISIAEKEDAFQKNLREIEDPFNRQIFGGLDSARDNEQLDALQQTVNDYVSPEQKKLSVEEAKKWTTRIDEKRDELRKTKAESYPAWSALMTRITQVQAGTAEIEVVRREIDRAIIPPEGQTATITPELAISLRERLEGIERSPDVKKRPSLTRMHASLGRLRDNQVALVTAPQKIEILAGQPGLVLEKKSDQQNIINIENSFIRIGTELDEYAETIAEKDNFDDLLNKKFQDLTRPIIQRVTLNNFELLFSPKREGFFTKIGFNTEAEELAQEKLDTLKDQPVWKTLTKVERKEAKAAFENGWTVDQVVQELSK